MKLLHLSDLHLGKRLFGCSLLEDQQYILHQILQILDTYTPDGLLIAGDIYDKSIPSTEAVTLFDDFLVAVSSKHLPVFIISGNHDSPERLSFGGRLMERQHVHLSPVYDGTIKTVPMEDAYGKVELHLLPFLKPAHVRRFFPEEAIVSYEDAVRVALSTLSLTPCSRHVLLCHQFVTGAACCESEELSIGGSEQISETLFDGFDYVALGHLHGPQRVGRDTIRYCGTPLKYSFSEVHHKKSVTLVELKEKGAVSVSQIPLTPLRDLKIIKGTYEEITSLSFYQHTTYPKDYLHITLTDEMDLPDAMSKLRLIYPNLLQLSYENTRTKTNETCLPSSPQKRQSPLSLFAGLYEAQNGQPMSKEQQIYMNTLIETIWEDAT